MSLTKPDMLVNIYENRIGRSTTEDEAIGYWVFVVGVIIGIIGITLAILSTEAGQTMRGIGNVLSSFALILLISGPIIRLPLTKKALPFLYTGALVSLIGIAWFASVYPEGWNLRFENNEVYIIGTYGLGILLISVGGVFTPLLTSPVRELEEAKERAEKAEAQIEVLEAKVTDILDSQSQFELYEDKSGKYRWRLVHRNGNIIADSSQGYSSKQKAQQGLNAVRRDALGGVIIDIQNRDEYEKDVIVTEMKSQSTFEIYEDKEGKYRWRLRHKNGNILCDSSRGYTSKNGRDNSIEKIRGYVLSADYLRTNPSAFEVFKDKQNKFRWRLVHKNGKILARSGQGYSSRQKTTQGIDSVQENIDTDNAESEIYKDKSDKYRWRMRHKNGNIISASVRGFDTEDNAQDALNRFKNNTKEANRLDIGSAVFEIYKDSESKFRWRLRHRNGNIISDSGQGYSSKQGAINGINSVKRDVTSAEIEEVETVEVEE